MGRHQGRTLRAGRPSLQGLFDEDLGIPSPKKAQPRTGERMKTSAQQLERPDELMETMRRLVRMIKGRVAVHHARLGAATACDWGPRCIRRA